jgi:hypothetical protein
MVKKNKYYIFIDKNFEYKNFIEFNFSDHHQMIIFLKLSNDYVMTKFF